MYLESSGTITLNIFLDQIRKVNQISKVPGNKIIKLKFEGLSLHTTDILEIREGLTDQSSYITTVENNHKGILQYKQILNEWFIKWSTDSLYFILGPVFSLSNQMFIMFKSNNWGQEKGFSAEFSSMNSICGGDEKIKGSNIKIMSPKLQKNGSYRRGYYSCRFNWIYLFINC